MVTYKSLDELQDKIQRMPNIKRNIVNVINIKELKKNLDSLNERELRRRQSR